MRRSAFMTSDRSIDTTAHATLSFHMRFQSIFHCCTMNETKKVVWTHLQAMHDMKFIFISQNFVV